MSDEVAILVWTGLMGVQVGKLFYDKWKSWQSQRQARLSDYYRICEGENRHGWQLALPRELIGHKEFMWYYIPHLPLLADDDTASESSVLVCIFARLHNRRVAQMRRYSLVSPTINSSLFKFTYYDCGYYDQWLFVRVQYLSRRSVAIIFRRREAPVYRFVVGDTCTRQMPRCFDVESPVPHEFTSMECAYFKDQPKARLMLWLLKVVPDHQFDDELNPPWRFEFHTISFEIPSADQYRRNPIRASGWETVSIPGGNRKRWAGFPMGRKSVVVISDYDALDTLEGHLCVTFDGEALRVESLPHWMRSVKETPIGAQMLDAFRSLDIFSPTPESRWYPIPRPLRHLTWLSLRYPHMAHYDDNESKGPLRRWCRPPSLQFRAAEAVFRAKPNLSRSRLKSVTKFDFFEEFPDETKEDETPVMYA